MTFTKQLEDEYMHSRLMDKCRVLPVSYLERKAQSIFATKPHKDRSNKYHFIPTIEVLNVLKSQGWSPISVQEQRVNNEERKGFQKHIVRLRNFDTALTFNGSCVELVLVNAHDGTSSYQLHAGIFRMVCLNGMVVGDSLFPCMKVRHHGYQEQDFIDISHQVIKTVPTISERVDLFSSVELNSSERDSFALESLSLKYKDLNESPLQANQLLRPRRQADTRHDLYTTYNVIQENLIRGGLLGRSQTGKYRRTRKVNSINESVRLNKGLWNLAGNILVKKKGAFKNV
jgi:hypothetical protein